MIFGGLSIRAFVKTRHQFSHVLSGSITDLNMSRYFRLMALGATQALFCLPIAFYSVIASFKLAPLKPWVSWADTHQNSGQVRFVRYETLSAKPLTKELFDLSRWITLGGAFLFFIFFGLSNEVRQGYKRILWRVAAPLGIKLPIPKLENTYWYAQIYIIYSCKKYLLYDPMDESSGGLAMDKTRPGTEGTTAPIVCAMFDAPAGDVEKLRSTKINHGVSMEAKVYDLESQSE